MSANHSVTFATANLFNFIEPPNAFYDFENIYESEAWQEKCEWTKHQILELKADIVGLQEVFSINAAKQLFTELGYPYFVTVDQPTIEQDYIYSQPVVALASKYPVTQVQAVTPCESTFSNYGINPVPFSRRPIHAVVSVPTLGEFAVYVCHLKSQRATEPKTLELATSIFGQWISTLQRGWEAVMLRQFADQNYAKQPMPSIILGDLNQPLSCDTIKLLVQNSTSGDNTLALKDSWEIYCANRALDRSPTHYHFSTGNVLDYILLSQEFHPDSSYSMADVVEYRVQDQHLINPQFERDKQASDHAFVSVSTQFII